MTVSSQTLLFLTLSVAAALPSAPTTATRLHGQTARLHAQILRSRRAPGGASRNIPRLVRAANLPTANTTTLIRALVPEDQRLASHLLHASVAAGRVPRTDAFSTVVAASRKAGDLDGARAALAALHECGLRANPTDCHALLAALCEAGRTDAAEGLYREMARAGTEVGHKTRAVLLTGLLNSGEGERALAFAHELLGGPYRDLASSPPDVPLVNVILQALFSHGAEAEAKSLLQELKVAGIAPDARTLSLLLSHLVKLKQLPSALEVFNAFLAAGGAPSAAAFNILIDGCARQAQLLNAEALAAQMDGLGVKRDAYTYNALISAAARAGRVNRALAQRRMMRRSGVAADAVTLTLLARALADESRGVEALRLARQAADGAGVKFDARLAAALLYAATRTRERDAKEAAEHARWVWAEMGRRRVVPDARCVAGHLVALGNAGDFDGARELFDAQPTPRDPRVWAAMTQVTNLSDEPAYASSVLSGAFASTIAAAQAAVAARAAPPAAASPSAEELSARTVPELKELCRAAGLLVGGNKAELVERLVADVAAVESVSAEEWLEE